MREYRGKRVDNGEWTYGYFFKIWEKTYILWGTTNDVPDMIEVHPDTVGQYTDRKDKNGVKIFEGSKLCYDNLGVDETCTVFWDEEDASWRVDFGKEDCMLSDLATNLVTVIGTIHDKE